MLKVRKTRYMLPQLDTHLFIENIYCEIFLSAVCLKLLRCRLTEPVLSANCLVLICRFFTRFVLISLCRLNYKLITESYNCRIFFFFTNEEVGFDLNFIKALLNLLV